MLLLAMFVAAGGGGASGKAERVGGGAKLTCAICKLQLMATMSQSQFQEHVDGKHSKMTFAQCWPDYKA